MLSPLAALIATTAIAFGVAANAQCTAKAGGFARPPQSHPRIPRIAVRPVGVRPSSASTGCVRRLSARLKTRALVTPTPSPTPIRKDAAMLVAPQRWSASTRCVRRLSARLKTRALSPRLQARHRSARMLQGWWLPSAGVHQQDVPVSCLSKAGEGRLQHRFRST